MLWYINKLMIYKYPSYIQILRSRINWKLICFWLMTFFLSNLSNPIFYLFENVLTLLNNNYIYIIGIVSLSVLILLSGKASTSKILVVEQEIQKVVGIGAVGTIIYKNWFDKDNSSSGSGSSSNNDSDNSKDKDKDKKTESKPSNENK